MKNDNFEQQQQPSTHNHINNHQIQLIPVHIFQFTFSSGFKCFSRVINIMHYSYNNIIVDNIELIMFIGNLKF
eukprot:UN02271